MSSSPSRNLQPTRLINNSSALTRRKSPTLNPRQTAARTHSKQGSELNVNGPEAVEVTAPGQQAHKWPFFKSPSLAEIRQIHLLCITLHLNLLQEPSVTDVISPPFLASGARLLYKGGLTPFALPFHAALHAALH